MAQIEERVNPALDKVLARAKRAGLVRTGIAPADLGVLLQMLATVTDIETPDVDVLLRRYLALVLDGLRPTGSRLPGASPASDAVHAAAAPTPPR
jgi:hypothetical protein